MKQTVIDILIYLFEHYIDDEIELEVDQDRVKSELRDAGFDGIHDQRKGRNAHFRKRDIDAYLCP